MENIYKNLETNESYSIIGEKDQVLQIVLKKSDAIVFKKQNLYYMSSTDMEETLHKNKNFFTTDKADTYGKRIKESNLIRLKNIKNTFEYIGIFGGGKIMRIVPMLYNDLFIRYDCLIAFSDTLDLLEVPEVKSKIEIFHKPDHLIQKDHKFYMVYSYKTKEKDFENFSLADYTTLKEFLYLSNESENNLCNLCLDLMMEKRLGKNEEITIKSNTLVCFEKSVSFNRIEDTTYKNINKAEYFTIQGPGLIIFELNHQNTKKIQAMKNLRLIGVLTLILTFLCLSHYLFEDYRDLAEE